MFFNFFLSLRFFKTFHINFMKIGKCLVQIGRREALKLIRAYMCMHHLGKNLLIYFIHQISFRTGHAYSSLHFRCCLFLLLNVFTNLSFLKLFYLQNLKQMFQNKSLIHLKYQKQIYSRTIQILYSRYISHYSCFFQHPFTFCSL